MYEEINISVFVDVQEVLIKDEYIIYDYIHFISDSVLFAPTGYYIDSIINHGWTSDVNISLSAVISKKWTGPFDGWNTFDISGNSDIITIHHLGNKVHFYLKRKRYFHYFPFASIILNYPKI